MFHRSLGRQCTHIAVLGNALPRRCGLATYTTHSVAAIKAEFPGVRVDHYAMDDGHGDVYGPDVAATIRADDVMEYVRGAAMIGGSGARALWIHHEFGIFGGEAGGHLLALLEHIQIPVVMTLHTVLATPNADQRRVMNAIVRRADRLIVMARHAARLLETVYGVASDRITIIPHGAPDRALSPTLPLKRQLGLADGPLMLTFGLLSPGKGIETALKAMPAIVAEQPDLHYLIVGATHPALIRREGERYRQSLIALIQSLGLEGHTTFIDRFMNDEELLDHLQACDIYLTPYLYRDQVTSGTLSYALAMGRPVISTPYIHAAEALENGIGTLVPFDNPQAISAAVLDHLSDRRRLEAQSKRVWDSARSSIWPENAGAVMGAIVSAISQAATRSPVSLADRRPSPVQPYVDIAGVAAMTDNVGIVQHSVLGVPDRDHGYCIDDNVRALKLICETRMGEPAERQRLARIYASFVQHAWNPDAGCFRNFMGFDRRWLESEGSEDSNGRTLWVLGNVMRAAPMQLMRIWAEKLFEDAFSLADRLTAPRAVAFAMLGAAAVLENDPGHERCRAFLEKSTKLFGNMVDGARRPSWSWFEIMLSYDNARLPQAMIEAGRVLGDREIVDLGLETLRWLVGMQSAPQGHFRPVGTEGFGRPYADPKPFDQQPLEAAATVDACLAAYRADGDESWMAVARTAMGWFTGENDLLTSLVAEDGSSCHDGLTPVGVNLNLGAESTLALQMARQTFAELISLSPHEGKPQLAVVQPASKDLSRSRQGA